MTHSNPLRSNRYNCSICRVIIEKPADPIQFLLETIRDEPFVFGAENAEEA